MKVIKLEGIINVKYAEVDKQPTIRVGLTGKIKVTLDDGRTFEDPNLTWDDSPHFTHSKLSKDEELEINEQIEEKLFNTANIITDTIKEISVIVITDTIKEKDISVIIEPSKII